MSITWTQAPVSMTEMGIYMEWKKNPSSRAYNITFLFKIPDGADHSTLKKAIVKALAAHPGLMSKFRMNERGEVVRLIPEGADDDSDIFAELISESYGDPDIEKLSAPFTDMEGHTARFVILHGSDSDHLFIEVHHIVYDGTSSLIFMEEINRAYRGEALAGEKISPAEAAEHEQRARQTEIFTEAKEYYRKLLSDFETGTSFIHDKEEGDAKTAYLEVPLSIDPSKLSGYVKSEGIRTSTFFTGVYGYLLQRFSGGEDALYSTVHSGRNDSNASTVGMFVKTFPIADKYASDESVSDHLKKLNDQISQSRQNDIYSYIDIAKDTGLSIPTLFAYQGEMFKEIDFLGSRTIHKAIESDDPKEETLVEVCRINGGYYIRIFYRTDLFDRDSFVEFARSYEKIVNEFLTKKTFGEIDIASEEQIKALDAILKEQMVKQDFPSSIINMFKEQVRLHPDNTALIIGDVKRTYSEIDELSDRIAFFLHEKGIGKGKVVSILIHRGEYMVTASLGVLKSGAGYQPLDPSYPAERLLFMVQDAEASYVIADEDLKTLIDGYEGEFLFTKDIPGLGEVPEDYDASYPDSDDLFTLLYTSGSTGTPKGVMIRHGNIANFCKWYTREHEMDERTVAAAYASYGFDANMMDMYPTLSCGGCICVVPEDMRMNMSGLGAYLEKHNVSISFMTTQVGRQFATSPYRPACLKRLLVGGEKLAPMDPPEGIKFVNVYGPTECTILATGKTVDKKYLRIPIGSAVAGAALYVVDTQGRRLPPGVPGELWISGPGVAGGYLNRPEKNAESFTANPFSNEPGYDRVYHTGDIVRYMPNGEIDFIGRNDGQVKIRGFRIELTEIESVIREHGSISDVTVQAYDNESGSGKFIAAFIVLKEDCDIAPGELENFIRKRKPPYMVPSVIMQIDEIPLNQNQKVDKRKLPKPEHKQAEGTSSDTRALTELEEELISMAKETVGSGEIGVSDALTDMGLTSISTMQLMSGLEEKYGFSPDSGELLGGMSILDIENALTAHWRKAYMSADSAHASCPDTVREKPDRAPLTLTQIGIYLECRMDEQSDQYNIPILLKADHDIDTDRLKRAIRDAVEAHPFMKCSIEPSDDGGAMMVAHPGLDWDIESIQSDDTDEEVEKKLVSEHIYFDLSKAPLFRFGIIRTRTSVYLHMVFHHIIMDGTSVAVLISDIEKAYQGETIEAETYDSLDLALDEKEKRQTDALKKAKAVYDGIFAGVSVSSLPAPEKNTSKEETGRAAACEYSFGSVDPDAVEEYCRANKITENELFTAAFACMLGRINGDDEVVFASIYNGRKRSETQRITGMLVKTYPFYVNTEKSRLVSDYLSDVAKRIRELTANDIYSFAEAVKDYGVSADVMFAYQGDNFSDYTLGGMKALSIPMPLEMAKEPLSVDVWKREGRYVSVFEYREDMYTDAQMKRMGDLYEMILNGLMKCERLEDISLMSDEAAAYLDKINDTDVELPFKPVHCLLEESAAKTPDTYAVITPSAKLTYKELNEAANRIAHALIDRGSVGRIVSLMLPRCEYVYMVRQGILKAGAAFLSIDPEYPDDRVKVMAEDSSSVILIVTKDLISEKEDLLKSLSCEIVTVEDLLRDERTDNPGLPAQKDDLAYCIFTSGSTGKPKGVMLTQGNLLNFVDANPKNPEILGYTDRCKNILALAAITFDVSVMEEFIPLSHGLTICMATGEEIHNPMALAKFIKESGVDAVTCTPSFLSNCIGLDVMKDALKQVKSYDLGAEAFPAALYDKIMDVNPGAYIMNGYGPTEATISCTMDQMKGDGIITIGRPASNVRAYIIDEQGRILPPLVPGELVIAGEGVGKGYIGREDLTAEKFFRMDGRPAYKTGDLAAWTSDGRIRFQGRADNQVKLRGLRVELGEIESAINAVDGILTSIVIMTGEENNKFLAGFYTASRKITPEEVKEEIGKTLTPYMVPGVLMQLDAMPLTANGKIDKKNLPKVEYVPEEAEYVAPANDVEKDFCGWFAEVLSMEKVSATANFFEYGGTSLSASVIAMRAEEKGYPVVYADIFKSQTPRALARIVTGESVQTAGNEDEISAYDYSRLDLSFNREENLTAIHKGDIANVLLTGSTGFLGMHVLWEYLHDHEGTIYCLVRGENGTKRLQNLYFYYFSELVVPYIESGRLVVILGDITDPDSLEAAKKYSFDTVINCAALVKHFVKDDSLERINVTGVKNLIKLCKDTGARLIQTSTVSVAGEGLDGTPDPGYMLKEDELYYGQLLDNAYINTKFKAERAVLEAVTEGMEGKIMRLGNLMGRNRDGEFQINFGSNAFVRSLASYKKIGAVPYSILNAQTDFSEIDMTARSILLLAGSDSRFTVFHPVNNHNVTYADIVYSMREYGMKIDTVEDDEFADLMYKAGDDAGALIAYRTKEGDMRRYMLGADYSFTAQALYRLGFKWPVSGEKYIVQMLKALNGMSMM